MIGERVGPYTLERKIGDGGMGVVYAASQDACIRQVAIKILLADLSRDQGLVQRFFKEVRATTAIDHPSIVQVHGADYAANGAAYIVMELLDGEALSARLQRLTHLSVAVALTLARQIATALRAAHEAGIIHRDLKPDNVFVVADPEAPAGERIKLLDFGIAKLAHDIAGLGRTLAGTVIGSPQYMSPEQCEDAGSVDERSDLYSLGCILFEMLSGRAPFLSDKPLRLISMHLQTPPPALSALVPGIPTEVEALVMQLLAKSPAERPASARHVEDALVRCGAVPAARRATIQTQRAVSGVVQTVPQAASEPRGSRARTRVGLALVALASLGLTLAGVLHGCV